MFHLRCCLYGLRCLLDRLDIFVKLWISCLDLGILLLSWVLVGRQDEVYFDLTFSSRFHRTHHYVCRANIQHMQVLPRADAGRNEPPDCALCQFYFGICSAGYLSDWFGSWFLRKAHLRYGYSLVPSQSVTYHLGYLFLPVYFDPAQHEFSWALEEKDTQSWALLRGRRPACHWWLKLGRLFHLWKQKR